MFKYRHFIKDKSIQEYHICLLKDFSNIKNQIFNLFQHLSGNIFTFTPFIPKS
jgi:hypothetical protein